MTEPTGRRIASRLQGTPVLHLADQVLSSCTNFLAAVVVARLATPQEFGVFSIFLVTFFATSGFNRAVPHAVAMTMEWDDDRARNGYFFLPPVVVGLITTAVLLASTAILDPSWLFLPVFLLPLMLQDAVRMHAFAVRKPQIALLSDSVWLTVEGASFLLVRTAHGAAAVWGLSGLCAFLVTRPWRIRVRVQRRPVRAEVVSAALEYTTVAGLAFLTPLLASPMITVLGLGALQGTNLIRGPIFLLMQGLLLHRMSGPPITPATCIREALHLSATTLVVTILLVPPLLLLRGVYGTRLLGATWPQVEPLILPALLTVVVASVGFGPATVVRKMGRFTLSAKLQGALAPLFVILPLAGAAVAGTRGFVYASGAAYVVFSAAWWMVLRRVAARPEARMGLAVT